MADERESRDSFQLIYDGNDIHDGEMDVSVLAPALLAVGELFKAADETINGSSTVVTTSVKADFHVGSFEIVLSVEQHLRDTAISLFPAFHLLGADKLISIVVGDVIDKAKEKLEKKVPEVITGLLKLLGVLKGEKPEAIRHDESTNTKLFVLGNNNTIYVENNTAALYEDNSTRSAANRIASPLNRAGISTLKAKRRASEVASLQIRDFPTVETPLSLDTARLENELMVAAPAPQELVVRIMKANFAGGKWSVSDGGKPFEVSMDDNDFKARVQAREVGFFDGDLYRVEMATSQKITGQRVSTSRSIVKVIEAVRQPEQRTLEESAPETKRNGRRFRIE
jgi:hypothetical protein